MLALRGGSLEELPASYPKLIGTRIEGEQIGRIARDNRCSPVELFVGPQATEANVRALQSPFLLHFATHGTFLEKAPPMPEISVWHAAQCRRLPPNPMACAWIALARANETLDSWRCGELPDPIDDGLLTAEEVATLDLSSTWLVTLSACNTGIGEARSGEGIFGLRRGFALAGARHVLLTLWPVADKQTEELMESFYAEALGSKDAPGALARVQKTKLAEWRKSDGPARAVRWAGAFVLSSQGR